MSSDTEITGTSIERATRSAVRCRVPVSDVGTFGFGTRWTLARAMRLASGARMMAPSIFASSRQPLRAERGVEQEAARADVEHLGPVAHDDERAHARLQDAVEALAQRRARARPRRARRACATLRRGRHRPASGRPSTCAEPDAPLDAPSAQPSRRRHASRRCPAAAVGRRARDDRPAEAEPGRLGQPARRLATWRSSPPRPTSPHATRSSGERRGRVQRRRDGERDGEVGARLDDPHAADGRRVHVGRAERMPTPLLEHGEQQRQPAAGRGPAPSAAAAAASASARRAPAPRRAAAGGPRSAARRPSPATPGAPVGEEQPARVGHADAARARPSRTGRARRSSRSGASPPAAAAARGGGRPRTTSTVSTTCSSTRGPGERAVLGDVADEHRRHAALLGLAHEPVRALAHLGDRAGRRAELGVVDRLDRVDDEHVGRELVDVGEHVRQRRLGRELAGRARCAPSRSARSRTCWRRLLGGDEQARGCRAAPCAASTWSSSVDLPMPGSPPSSVTEPGTSPPPSTRSSSATPVGRGGARRRGRPRRSATAAGVGASGASRRRRRALELLDEGVPRLARRAAAEPLGALAAALAAPVDRLQLRHANDRTTGVTATRTASREQAHAQMDRRTAAPRETATALRPRPSRPAGARSPRPSGRRSRRPRRRR